MNGRVTVGQRVVLADTHHTIEKASSMRRALRPFWVVPTLITVAAFALGLVLPRLDSWLSASNLAVFRGGPEGARSVLGTIASAMISVTGLVFSITIVVLQLASSQFTPRVLTHFLSDRVTQWTLGVFIASFVYSLTVLRDIRGGFDGNAFIPQVSVTFAFVLVVSAVAVFLVFIHRITSMIQVSHVVSRLGDATCSKVEQLFPEVGSDRPTGVWRTDGEPVRLPARDKHGHVVEVDEKTLVTAAAEHGLRVELLVQPGDFIAPGSSLALIWGGRIDEELRSSIEGAVSLSSARSLAQDPRFGVRQLIDIADRALSPGVNDPTTAVQVVEELRRVLGVAVVRDDPSWFLADDEGTVRLRRPQVSTRTLLQLAVEEIGHYGRESVQVPRALTRLLDELAEIATPAAQSVVREARNWLPEVDRSIDVEPRPGKPRGHDIEA